MNTQVRYYTQSGNTKKLAEAIAAVAGCSAQTVDSPMTEAVDVLFLGASVYKFGIDKSVIQFIDQLDATKVKAVAIFSTSSMSDSGTPKIAKRLEAKGIKVLSQHFYCKGQFMFANKNRPNQDDVAAAKAFATSVVNA